MQKVLQHRCKYTDTWKWATKRPGTDTDTHLCSLQYSPAAMGTWSASASLWEWCPWAAACGTGAYSLPPEINTHTQSQNANTFVTFCITLHLHVHPCMSLFNLGGEGTLVCMWYLYENVETWIFLLPGLDLVQGPWLVAAEPGCQFLEPLPLCTTKLKHTCTHKHYS